MYSEKLTLVMNCGFLYFCFFRRCSAEAGAAASLTPSTSWSWATLPHTHAAHLTPLIKHMSTLSCPSLVARSFAYVCSCSFTDLFLLYLHSQSQRLLLHYSCSIYFTLCSAKKQIVTVLLDQRTTSQYPTLPTMQCSHCWYPCSQFIIHLNI